MSPDPVMQAPFWTQGQNRYSYVFNDPINATDPSGFAAGGPSDWGTAGAVVAGSPQTTASIYVLAHAAGAGLTITAASIATGLGGGGINSLFTAGMNPFGGIKGASYQVPSGGAAASSTGGGVDAPIATAQHTPLGPRMPGVCEWTGACLTQDAGSPSSGAEGSSASGDTATRDPGTLASDAVAVMMPLPGPSKATAAWKFLNWLRKVLRIGNPAARGASTVLGRTSAQLASKFKHAKDFGVVGNYSKANAAEFSRAIHQHVNSPGVRAIQGTYHKAPVTHYLDPSSGLNVIADPAGNFVSGWRLGAEQLKNVLAHGGL